MIHVKRAYEPSEPGDGPRYLVDRLWPRGVKKEALLLDGWLKDLAPSEDLRRWFGHDPARWEEFRRRYEAELAGNSQSWHFLLDISRKQDITLLFSAHDPEHNNAVVLRSFLEEHRKA